MKKIILLLSVMLIGISIGGCKAPKEEPKDVSQEGAKEVVQQDDKDMSQKDENVISEGDMKDIPICGGITDYTDENAPKEIKSKNIVDFSAAFFIYDKYDYDKAGFCNIKIADNEKGEHVLKFNGIYNHEVIIDDRVLVDVQAIIDKYELVKKNGDGRVTAGLPAEYQPWSLTVNYDSGEKLHFYENGAPEADWTSEFRDYFIDVLATAGCEDALPLKETVTIDNFSFAFDIDGDYHSYCLSEHQGDEDIYLWHYAYDMDTLEDIANEYAAITDALYEGLQKVIETSGMDVLNVPGSVGFDLEPSKDGFLEIYIDYVSGRQIYGEYESSELPDEWLEMKAALIEFLDNYISENLSFTE